MTVLGVLAMILSSLLFGLSFLFTKMVTNEVQGFALLAWRFVLAALLMTLLRFMGVFRIRFRGKPVGRLLLLALLEPVIYFIGELFGIQLTTASESGTIIACIPIMTVILSALILKEPPTLLQTLGIAASIAGVVMLVLVKGFEASLNGWGYALLLLAVLSTALYTVLSRKLAMFSSVEKTYMMALTGAAAFTVLALAEHGAAGTLRTLVTLPLISPSFLFAVLYLTVGCSVTAFLCSNYAIMALGAVRSASFAGLTTVISILAGVIVLRESFTLWQGVGTALVLAGLYTANFTRKKRAPAGSPPKGHEGASV